MSITTFAAIYIGSYEVSMKIFEISGRKKIKEIDYLRHRLEIGKDAYTKHYISYEIAEEICDCLMEYTNIMKGYRVDAYKACASTAFRSVQNELFVIDQIKRLTDLDVQVLSNSEHRFISYKSVASQNDFEVIVAKSAAVVDIGGGSIQITLFIDGKAITTQNMLLGTVRIYEKLVEIGKQVFRYNEQIEELVDKELEGLNSLYTGNYKIQNVILIGDYGTEIINHLQETEDNHLVSSKKFISYLTEIENLGEYQMAEKLDVMNEKDRLLLPSIILYKRIVEKLSVKSIWVPGLNMNDGICFDYAQKNGLIKLVHDFDKDIISASEFLASRYGSYTPHITALVKMSTLIFDSMKRIHNLGKREKLLLQVAAILHDCGKYVSFVNGPESSYSIIMASEIIGLSHLEREIVASTVKYNSYALDPYEEVASKMDQHSYMIVAKLAAILRLSNAMDRSHKQKFKNVKANLQDKTLIITIEYFDDIILEKGLFYTKSDSFERIFGIKPVIKEKRIV